MRCEMLFVDAQFARRRGKEMGGGDPFLTLPRNGRAAGDLELRGSSGRVRQTF